jgi:hypothetical protein
MTSYNLLQVSVNVPYDIASAQVDCGLLEEKRQRTLWGSQISCVYAQKQRDYKE